ncbi:MAG: homing endonuclease associated repeat-containing protein [Acidobacteriaceae bacterium]
MRFELEEHHRNVTDNELIADVQRVASQLGKDCVTIDEQNEHGRFNAVTLMRRFGGWLTALERAGLQQTRTPMYNPEEDLFRNIEEVWIKLGRQPHYRDVRKPVSRFSAKTYINRFGSWRSALQAFVNFINSETETSEVSTKDKPVVARKQCSRDINWRLRFIVMRRDNFKCKACGRSPATDPAVTLDVDHIKAWSKDGPTVLENLQTLCTKCNIGKSDLEFLNLETPEVQNV